jgi:adenine/guanine phosphoribosyltransferase-like PRPP-binding protein
MRIKTYYLDTALDGELLDIAVRTAQRKLNKYEFDSIACRGMSGTLFSGALASRMKKNLILVRKEKDDSHASNMRVEGAIESEKYIIIDDFICSGQTIKAILDNVKHFATSAQCVGVYFYYDIDEPLFYTKRLKYAKINLPCLSEENYDSTSKKSTRRHKRSKPK